MAIKVHCEINTKLHSCLAGIKHFSRLNGECGVSYLQELMRCVWRHLVGILNGDSPTLCSTSSLLHTLGSVTVSMAAGKKCFGCFLPLKIRFMLVAVRLYLLFLNLTSIYEGCEQILVNFINNLIGLSSCCQLNFFFTLVVIKKCSGRKEQFLYRYDHNGDTPWASYF